MIISNDKPMLPGRGGRCFGWVRRYLLMPLYCVLTIASVLVAWTQMATAQAPVTILEGTRVPTSLEGHIDHLIDPSRALTIEDITAGRSEDFERVTTTYPDFGYTQSNIWLRLTLENATKDVRSWRIHIRENFKQFMAIHVVRPDGTIDTTYDLGPEDPFSKRPVPYPEMVAPMDLAPDETATLYINYWSEGSSHLAFDIKTEFDFATRAATRTAKNFLYYGMAILPVMLALLGLVIYRHAIFVGYIALWMSALLFVMHSDGTTFQYLWPNSPALNNFASIPLGVGIIIFSPLFTRIFLNTRRNHPILDKLLLTLIFVALGMLASSAFLDNQILKKALILMSLVSVSLCAFSGLVAARTRFKEVRFFVIAWVGFLGASALMSMRHWLGVEISQDVQDDAIRSVMVVDSVLLGLSIADRYNQLRQSRQRALRFRYEEENRNLKLLARLSELEKRYAQETEKLQDRDVASANTLHDLQQPIAALRLNIRALVDRKDVADNTVEDMDGSFAYIERLMTAAAQQRVNEVTSDDLRGPDSGDKEETFGLRKVTDSVMQMFLPDAAAKGLELRYYPSDDDVKVEPLAAMRVLSNLLSNAIKYTDTGKILFCVRKRGDALRVEIHDTGPGLSREEFEQAKTRSTRIVETSQGKAGEGLGLSIVQDTALSAGYDFNRLCNRNTGLSVGVTIPRT